MRKDIPASAVSAGPVNTTASPVSDGGGGFGGTGGRGLVAKGRGMKRIIQVFPRQTSYTPEDEYAFYGLPPIVIPEHDEVHISCAFTWDRETARELAFQWEGRIDKPVLLGGPAFGSPAGLCAGAVPAAQHRIYHPGV